MSEKTVQRRRKHSAVSLHGTRDVISVAATFTGARKRVIKRVQRPGLRKISADSTMSTAEKSCGCHVGGQLRLPHADLCIARTARLWNPQGRLLAYLLQASGFFKWVREVTWRSAVVKVRKSVCTLNIVLLMYRLVMCAVSLFQASG